MPGTLAPAKAGPEEKASLDAIVVCHLPSQRAAEAGAPLATPRRELSRRPAPASLAASRWRTRPLSQVQSISNRPQTIALGRIGSHAQPALRRDIRWPLFQ